MRPCYWCGRYLERPYQVHIRKGNPRRFHFYIVCGQDWKNFLDPLGTLTRKGTHGM